MLTLGWFQGKKGGKKGEKNKDGKEKIDRKSEVKLSTYERGLIEWLTASELLALRSKQQKLVKYIDSMAEQGGITCKDHKIRIPEKVHKKFKAFLMVH